MRELNREKSHDFCKLEPQVHWLLTCRRSCYHLTINIYNTKQTINNSKIFSLGGYSLSDSQNSTLTPMHLRKAKLMFFWVRYPSSAILKMYFPDIKFNKNNTAQLVKWFSNFRSVSPYLSLPDLVHNSTLGAPRDQIIEAYCYWPYKTFKTALAFN